MVQLGSGKELSMKIEYKFADKAVSIEVDEHWGEVILELDRQEYNVNHKETRRHTSLDGCLYEGKDLSYEDENLSMLFEENQEKKLYSAISKLKPKQQELIKAVFFQNISLTDYAKNEGVTVSAVSQRLSTALKKLKKFF